MKVRICPVCNCEMPLGTHYAQKTCGTACGKIYKERRRQERQEVYRPPVGEAVLPAGRTITDPRNAKRPGRSPFSIGVFDIETSGLNAAFGRILCCVVETYDPHQVTIYRADEFPAWKAGRRSDDYEITAAICAKLEDIDILVAHNGVGFDLRFLRTRALEHGLPPLNPAKIVDPVLAARRNLRLPSNSLDSIARHIKASNEKTVLEPGLWARAVMDGDKQAMDYIVEHCQKDVEVLAEVTWSLRGYIRVIDALGSYR